MKVSKNSKNQTHKKSIKLTKIPNDELARQVPANAGPWRAKRGDPFEFFNIHPLLQNIRKLKGEKNLVKKKFRKKSHNAENKMKGGFFGIFQHPFCCKTSQNWKGHFGEFFFRKNLTMPEKLKGWTV